MSSVHIVMGSASDKETIMAAGMASMFDAVGVSYEVTVCSAHRNLPELEVFTRKALDGGAKVFIGVAGMAAALPGALAGCTGMVVPIIGVPMDAHGIDSCIYMPPGVPVLTAGVGKTGLKQAALAACQILAVGDANVARSLSEYVTKTNKKPQYNVSISESGSQAAPETKPTGNRVLLAEGKTKRVWELAGEPGLVEIESKDDITAGDGAKHDVLENKAVVANQTTSNVFELLVANGIDTHFIGRMGERSFKARGANMIPLELVARRIATGSYLKRRPDVVEGTVFDNVIIEFFEKDDANHDPLVVFDYASQRLMRYIASKPLGEGFMNEQPLQETPFANLTPQLAKKLIDMTRGVFLTLETAWAKQDVQLVDLKIEAGWVGDGMSAKDRLVVADVIDNDSWRIWPHGDKTQMKDKQVYRNLANVDDPAAKAKELGKIKKNYAWVADATAKFNKSA